MFPPTRFIAVLTVSALSAAVIACSSDDPSAFSTTTPEPAPAATTAPAAAPEPTIAPAPAAGGDASAGEQAFGANGCSTCHSTGGNTIVGPGLASIGSRGDADYILESIKDPGAVIVDGFANLMPTSFASLPEEDLDNLVAYLLTLN